MCDLNHNLEGVGMKVGDPANPGDDVDLPDTVQWSMKDEESAGEPAGAYFFFERRESCWD